MHTQREAFPYTRYYLSSLMPNPNITTVQTHLNLVTCQKLKLRRYKPSNDVYDN